MASASTGDVGRHLRQLFGAGSAVGLTDGELLERFARRRDRVGRGRLRDDPGPPRGDGPDRLPAGARRRARGRGRLPGHLPGPGPPGRVAAGPRARLARSLAARGRVPHRPEGAPGRRSPAGAGASGRGARGQVGQAPPPRSSSDELRRVLHDEVNRLPAKYRAPVVLCYFEGRTHDEAAAALQWPVGTVRGRLARARDLLRSRLTRRGLAPAGWIGASRARDRPPGSRSRAAAARRPSPPRSGARRPRPSRAGEPHAEGPAHGTAQDDRGRALDRLDDGRLRPRPPRRAGIAAPATARSRPGTGRGGPAPIDPGRSPRRSAAEVRPRPHGDDPVPRRLPGQPGPLHARRQVPGHGRPRTRVVRVWDAATGRIVREIGDSRPTPEIMPRGEIALSPDGKTLATIESPEPAPALGPRHRAASAGGGTRPKDERVRAT